MTRFQAFISQSGALALAVLSSGSSGVGQVVAEPPQPGTAVVVPGGLEELSRQMGREVHGLAEAISVDLGPTEQGRHLLEDTRELDRAVDEFRGNARAGADRFQARRAYAGIDVSWHHLMNQLSRPGLSTPAVDRAAQAVAQSDARIHQMLGVNELPPGYNGNEALTGVPDVRRLAHALHDRAEAFAAVARVDFAGPGGSRLVREAVNLSQAADTFHDSLDLNRGGVDDTTRNSFAVVDGLANRLEAELARVQVTPRVRDAWQSYKSAEVLIHQSLGLPNEAADLTNTVLVPAQAGPSPVVGLADQLVQQAGAFVQVFSQTGRSVPEGGQFLADAQVLLSQATNFRQDTARPGITPSQLAFEFRDVDAVWQRLARRTQRIARGRTGPNIQQVGAMGQTVSEIHRLLGMPGYAPVIGTLP